MVVTVSHPAECLPYDLKIIGLNPAQAPKSQDIHSKFSNFVERFSPENVLYFQTVNLNYLNI
jgi:hypothetical protein